MKGCVLFVFAFIASFSCKGQNDVNGFKVKNISYNGDNGFEYNFPKIDDKSVAATRINTFLWASYLNILPGKKTDTPFAFLMIPSKSSNQGTTDLEYKILKNDSKLFTVSIHYEYTGMSLNESDQTYNFDAQTGFPVSFRQLLSKQGYESVGKEIINNRKERLRQFLKTADTTAKGSVDPEMIPGYQECLRGLDDEDPGSDDFQVSRDLITVTMPPCFDSHYFQVEDDADIYVNRFTGAKLLPYLSEYGKWILGVTNKPVAPSVATHFIGDRAVYTGTLGKYPITFVFTNFSGDSNISGIYFYDSAGEGIKIYGGMEKDGVLMMSTDGDHAKEMFALKVNGVGNLAGTWTKGSNIYPVTLQ